MSGNVNANLYQIYEWFAKSCGECVCLDLMRLANLVEYFMTSPLFYKRLVKWYCL